MAFLANKVIRTLIKADLIFLSAFGLINPIFAIFITQQIKGGNVEIIGFAAAIYWVSKSLVQIPIGKFLDRRKGERDDLWFLVGGYVLAGLVPFCYIFSSLPWHIYVLQVIYGIAMAMAFPSWTAIFTRHIDKGKEAFEWSIEGAVLDFGTGIGGAIGGILVSKFGFNMVFVIVGAIALIGGLLPLLIRRDVLIGDDRYIRLKIKKPPFL